MHECNLSLVSPSPVGHLLELRDAIQSRTTLHEAAFDLVHVLCIRDEQPDKYMDPLQICCGKNGILKRQF